MVVLPPWLYFLPIVDSSIIGPHVGRKIIGRGHAQNLNHPLPLERTHLLGAGSFFSVISSLDYVVILLSNVFDYQLFLFKVVLAMSLTSVMSFLSVWVL